MKRLGVWLAAGALVAGGLATTAPGAVAADPPESGVPLPAGPADTVANGVAFAGDTVFASFRPAAAPDADGIVYRTPADGSGSWVPVTAPGSGTPLTAPTDSLVARGDVLLLRAAADDPATPCDDYRLITPTAERAMESCGAAPVLGHGGRAVARRTSDPLWLVQLAATGTSRQAFEAYRTIGIDGDMVWRAKSRLVGTSTLAGSTSRTIPPECSSADTVGAFGRFALLDCDVSSVLIDLTGDLTPRRLPPGSWRLGNGFAFDDDASDPGAPEHREIRVVDFSSVHTVHSYGWSSGNGAQNATGRAEPDDAGGHSLVMLTEAGQVERVDLDWLGEPPTQQSDATPPVLDALSGSPAVVSPESLDTWRTTRVDFSWTAHDPGDSTEPIYDVRIHDSSAPDEPYWNYPAAWQGRLSDAVHWNAAVDAQVCFSVRARDWVGNLSAGPDDGWSAPRCTRVASRPPTTWGFLPRESDRLGIRDAVGPNVVAYSFSSDDDVFGQTVSHDVEYRLAGPGQQLGPWISPTSWRRIMTTSVSQSAPSGGEICFRARGWDPGSAGPYTVPSCVSVPYDDRAFKIRDGAKRIHPSGALGRTATRLRHGEGVMVRRGERGREVWVRLLGNPAYCAGVTLGGRHGNGCFMYQTNGAIWQQFRFRAGSHGRLRITGSLRVDAVAVVR